MEESERQDREEIYAKAVRAGKRTYFFDIRATRANDYYLTITESKRKYNDDGTFYYQKHKIFLYKEDFEKFSDALTETISKVTELKMEQGDSSESENYTAVAASEPSEREEVVTREADIESDSDENLMSDSFTDVRFEDLDDENEPVAIGAERRKVD